MATQRSDLMVSPQAFNFTPTTLEEAQKYATIFASSGLCPAAYRGRPNDILIVWQMGEEIGLKKMQALRTLGCINGMPFAWGDGLLALVKRHPEFDDIKEWLEGDINLGTATAFCTIKRVGEEPHTQKFSIEDAKRAGLWGKAGTWTQYPKRMLQHRARTFACRDKFPDALFGLPTDDEVRHIPKENVVDIQKVSASKGVEGFKAALGLDDNIEDAESEVIEGELQAHDERALKLVELKELIAQCNIAQETIDKHLDKIGLTIIDELSVEMIDKWSNFLKSKEQRND